MLIKELHRLLYLMRYSDRFFAYLLLFVLLAVAAPMLRVPLAQAADTFVVSIFVDDQKVTFPTDAATVGGALERAGVTVGKADLVEPDPSTAINQDAFNINIYRARPVLVMDGPDKKTILSPYQSPRLIAEHAGFTVHDQDLFRLERIDDILVDGAIGLKLTIIRAHLVSLHLYGTVSDVYTQATTVDELLRERGITPDETDIIRPSINDTINNGSMVWVIRVGNNRMVVEEPVSFSERRIQDSSRLVGSREIQTPGVLGSKLVTYQVRYEDGIEHSREAVGEVMLVQPKEQVTIVGTKVQDPSANVGIGESLAAERGWTDGEWACLYELWMKESHWNHLAANPYTGAYGIPQALPGSKMGSVAGDWETNPATQISWGLNYIAVRYGTPCSAWNFFLGHNWY